MKSLYVTKTRPAEPSILSVIQNGESYNYSLIHSSITQVVSERTGQFGKPHKHGVYHLLLYREGNNRILYNGKTLQVIPGTLLLCSPGMEHDFFPCSKGSLEYAEITFEYLSSKQGALLIPFHKLLEMISRRKFFTEQTSFRLNSNQNREFMDLFREYCTLQEDPRSGTFETHIILSRIFSFLYSLDDHEEDQMFAEKTAHLIQSRLTEKLDLETLSQELGCSKTYINREFKKYWNTTAMEYHRHIRLVSASDVLRSSSLPLKQVALQFGFFDVYHFSRCFQKQFGIPPGEFRKQHQQ